MPRCSVRGHLYYNNPGLTKRYFYVTGELELQKGKDETKYSILQANSIWNNTMLAEAQNTLGKFKSCLKNYRRKDKIFFSSLRN